MRTMCLGNCGCPVSVKHLSAHTPTVMPHTPHYPILLVLQDLHMIAANDQLFLTHKKSKFTDE